MSEHSPNQHEVRSDQEWIKVLNADRYLHPDMKDDDDEERWGYLEALEGDDNPHPILDLNKQYDSYMVGFNIASGYPTLSPGKDNARYCFEVGVSEGAWNFSFFNLNHGVQEVRSLEDEDIVKLGGHRFTFHDTITPRDRPPLEGAFTEYSLVQDIADFTGDIEPKAEGSFGKVYRAVIRKEPGKGFYAIKVIEDAASLSAGPTYEISCWQHLEHDHIRKLERFFSTNGGSLHLVSKYAEGGTLRKWLESPSVWASKASPLSFNIFHGHIMYQICSAVQYIHSKGIIHRDIKPENILIESASPLVLKVADFSLSTFDPNPTDKDCGTWFYRAPEIPSTKSKGSYTNAVDVYAVGAVFLTMLMLECGHRLRDLSAIVEHLLETRFDITSTGAVIEVRNECMKHFPSLLKCNPEALNLLKELIHLDPKQRLSMKAALAHPWFCDLHRHELGLPKFKRLMAPDDDIREERNEGKAVERPAKRAKIDE